MALDKNDYLLCSLIKQCAAITVEASHCLRFGMDHSNPGAQDYPTTNQARLHQTMMGLLALADLLYENKVLPRVELGWVEQAIFEEQERLQHYLQFSEDLGRVSL